MASPERFELPTRCLGRSRSIQLSYGDVGGPYRAKWPGATMEALRLAHNGTPAFAGVTREFGVIPVQAGIPFAVQRCFSLASAANGLSLIRASSRWRFSCSRWRLAWIALPERTNISICGWPSSRLRCTGR